MNGVGDDGADQHACVSLFNDRKHDRVQGVRTRLISSRVKSILSGFLSAKFSITACRLWFPRVPLKHCY